MTENEMNDLMTAIGQATQEKIKYTNSELYSTIKLITISFSLISLVIIIFMSILFFMKNETVVQAPKQIIIEKDIAENSVEKSIKNSKYLFKTKCVNHHTYKYYRKNNGIIFEYYTISTPGC